jgi:hypothetical protein
MATNFKITSEKPSVRGESKEYEMVREHKKEQEQIMAIKKELEKHKKTPLQKAHPMPNMRK